MKAVQGVNPEPVRILIADDSPAIRHVLRLIIANEKGWKLCAAARNGSEALAMALRCRIDVAILDVSMPGMDGLEATRQISEILPETKTVILTVHDSDELEAAVVACGADGYVLKSRAATELVPAVRQVLEDKPYFRGTVGQPWQPAEAGWKPHRFAHAGHAS